MPLTSNSIRNALRIEDQNITFDEDCRFETINGQECLVYYGLLTCQPSQCKNCGLTNQLVKFGFNTNRIIVPAQGFTPTYLMLKRQRFQCRACHSLFDAQTDYVLENCQIAQPVRKMILLESILNSSLKDIAQRFNVSDKTVQRVIDDEAKRHASVPTTELPAHIAMDEFKATDSMSFIWGDSTQQCIAGLLPSRTSASLHQYFERFPLKVRQSVKTVSVDLNAGYVNVVKSVFPKAEIVVDRFHIAQMLNRAVNQQRIRVMNNQPKSSKKYKFMKRDWKQFLRPFAKLEAKQKRYHKSVGYYDTELNLVTECLALDETFQTAYDVYQNLLEALKKSDTDTFEAQLDSYRPLDISLDTTIKTFRKYRQAVLNAVTSDYSNGYLEGLISHIKKIKNTAYGYRNWNNFMNRIKIRLSWFKKIEKKSKKVPRPMTA